METAISQLLGQRPKWKEPPARGGIDAKQLEIILGTRK